MPWLMFVALSCLFAFAYNHYAAVVWCVTAGFFVICAVFAVLDSRNRMGGGWYFSLALLCFFACLTATVSGIYNYQQHFYPFWAYDENRAYSNVLPSEPAAAHGDAGKIIFANNARVDTTRAVGYKSGTVYCVAPIMDDTQTSRVEYWAAGVDCCMQRADFHCDDAWNNAARSGVVVIDQEDLFFPSTNKRHAYYMKAVKEAEAAYDIVSAEEPIFVRWVSDPQSFQDNFWRSGVGFLIASCCVYLLVSIILGAIMQMSSKRNAQSQGAAQGAGN